MGSRLSRLIFNIFGNKIGGSDIWNSSEARQRLKSSNRENHLSQRTSEWIEAVDLGYLEYHRRQFETPYRSTIAFSKWLRTLGLPTPNTRIADIGCGMGAALNYLA